MEKDIKETIESAMKEVTMVDKTNNMIFGICAFKPVSKNNRVYKEKAVETLLGMLDGKKCFRNHGSTIASSGVEDLIGEHTNPRLHNGGIYTDLSVLETARYKDLIFDVAKNKPHLCGMSIVARGKFSNEMDAEGREQIVDVVSLQSCDLVGSPATTNGCFEEKKEEEQKEKMSLEQARAIFHGTTLEDKEKLERARAIFHKKE